VYFDVDKAELKPESKPALDNIEAMMRMFPSMVIEVRGHTDSTGNSQYNLRLSERRAAAVRTELIKRGIAAERIRAVGFGDTQPIADIRTPEGRAQNRRTEFIIFHK
jgi:outer membrane protein OmpA-like peptidoglycan-associated protein